MIFFIVEVVKVVFLIARQGKIFLMTRQLDLEWHEYIEIPYVVVAACTIAVYLNCVFGYQGKFKLPMDAEELDDLIDHLIAFREYVRL